MEGKEGGEYLVNGVLVNANGQPLEKADSKDDEKDEAKPKGRKAS